MEGHQSAQEVAAASTSGSSLHNGSSVEATPPPPAPPPLTPKPVPKYCETYPTTFVQADTSSFKQVVQMLTGFPQTAAATSPPAMVNPTPAKVPSPSPLAAKATGPKKPAFKLYERRNSMKNLKLISPLAPAFFGANSCSPGGSTTGFSPRRQPEILSPSMLDFPSLALSPVTPLIPDPFNRPLHPSSEVAKWAEERAIAEKGFYLHPSPRATTPRDADPPRLLPLFPVTSPRASSAPPSPP